MIYDIYICDKKIYFFIIYIYILNNIYIYNILRLRPCCRPPMKVTGCVDISLPIRKSALLGPPLAPSWLLLGLSVPPLLRFRCSLRLPCGLLGLLFPPSWASCCGPYG